MWAGTKQHLMGRGDTQSSGPRRDGMDVDRVNDDAFWHGTPHRA